MVFVGKTKMNKTRQISLIKDIADIFEIEEGEYINFYAEDGNIIIRKTTVKYDGFDFEREMIEERVRDLEIDIMQSGTAMLDELDNMEERKSAAYEIFNNEMKKRRANKSK